jgi:hypothetical protein
VQRTRATNGRPSIFAIRPSTGVEQRTLRAYRAQHVAPLCFTTPPGRRMNPLTLIGAIGGLILVAELIKALLESQP